MIVLVLSEKMIFPFPENMILHLRWKMKDDLKKYMEIWYFLQTFWKDGLSIKGRAGTWSFLYYLERWYFFHENMIFFHWAESERRPLPGNTWKHDASPGEEKQETWYTGLKHIHYWSYIHYWIILNTLYHPALKDCVWGCAWAPIREIICPLGDRL